ncbi:zinc ribbon domain-containing protein [Halobacteria archaeon AArc-m2/3/4]|uniref:Zinc ribbon domain-containing protein n=1 Tax=Natronoglomus mannanivorans TaxID=2979990 RepID=A0ABT2QDE2_9EURY|nr:zinc ribbon domain-containing protein [Halobacteria archaeon AArc-m2/3/4]
MSKITFRADDDLVTELETFDASKSEVMRDALRAYLDEHGSDGSSGYSSLSAGDTTDSHLSSPSSSASPSKSHPTIDDLVRKRVDERLAAHLADREPQDVNVSITLEDADVGTRQSGTQSERKTTERKTDLEDPSDTDHECGQCGEILDDEHVYCPNCGEKASKRAFCECGDEVRSDWAFCPSCGRRTPAADVLDSR